MPRNSFHLSALPARRADESTPRFHVESYAREHRTIVRAHGEIDMATGGRLQAALTAALDQKPQMLAVDLDGVSFLDACGLGVLVSVANEAARVDIPLMIISARPHVYRLFDLTHLVDRLNVHARPPVPVPLAPDQGHRPLQPRRPRAQLH